MAKQPVYKNLLEHWAPPLITGNEQSRDLSPVPIAFFSTTFTFDAEFFEEECLTRFLSMETEKENDGAAYLVEREEKLAGLQAGIVLVDQQHCKGSRSLRWDLAPCRVKNGIMHAKITILHWSNCIRLIVGSANLTTSGYCINQEVFCAIDYYPDSDADLKLISGVLKYLQAMTNDLCGATVKERYSKFQSSVNDTLKKWRIRIGVYAKDDVSAHTLLVSPKQKNALANLREIWDSRFNSPPDTAYITSPFFDSEESDNTPSKILPDILQQRGPVTTYYSVTTENVSEEDSRLIVNAPEFLKKEHRNAHAVIFENVLEEGMNENNKLVPRPLHLKSIWLSKDDEMHLLQIGSSNFTSAALGLGRRCNYEANLVFTVYKSRNKKGYESLAASCIDTTAMDDCELLFRQRENMDEAVNDIEHVDLPAFFNEAILQQNGKEFKLELNFASDSSAVPKNFRVLAETKQEGKTIFTCIYDEVAWLKSKPQLTVLHWKESDLPDYLLVEWESSNGKAYWPVIAASQDVLPAVDSLKGLPLDALLYILSSSQPLHRLVGAIERIKNKSKGGFNEESALDPHQLVDTTGFLLQRTRRVSYAMKALRNRLEKPVFTQESLVWRLHGPIGVKSLQEAIVNEAKSDEEKRFLLAELALELSRVHPQQTEISLKRETVKAAIKNVLDEMAPLVVSETKEANTQLEKYALNAVNKAIHELSI
jgi:hypothetical protein